MLLYFKDFCIPKEVDNLYDLIISTTADCYVNKNNGLDVKCNEMSVLWFLSELAESIYLLKSSCSCEFNDFYGEYSVSLKLIANNEIILMISFPDEIVKFKTDLENLKVLINNNINSDLLLISSGSVKNLVNDLINNIQNKISSLDFSSP